MLAEIEKQQQAFQLLQKQNTELVSLSEQIPVELEQLQAELEAEKENYENACSAVEQAELARERKKKHLRDGHEIYESRLALRIQTSKKDGESFEWSTYADCQTIQLAAFHAVPPSALVLPLFAFGGVHDLHWLK